MCSGWCNNWVTRQHARCNNENTHLYCTLWTKWTELRVALFYCVYSFVSGLPKHVVMNTELWKQRNFKWYWRITAILILWPLFERRYKTPVNITNFARNRVRLSGLQATDLPISVNSPMLKFAKFLLFFLQERKRASVSRLQNDAERWA